jgi:paraquat-inducible protein A
MEALTRRSAMLGLLLTLNVVLLWYGLTADAVTIGVTVRPQVLGFSFRISDERATYSILDAIWKLKSDGNVTLFLIVFIFSVVFPTTKLLGNIWIWSRVVWYRRHGYDRMQLRAWAQRLAGLGKWSMLEVFMAGLLCSLLKVGDMVRLIVEPGLYWFVAAVLVSIISAVMTKKIAATISGEGLSFR